MTVRRLIISDLHFGSRPAPPGGDVPRATGGELELRGMLDDCDKRDLARMLGDPPRRAAA